ncbi:MAG: hypothetical protein ACJ8EQ_06315, partial [Sphingomicrobium sp.]
MPAGLPAVLALLAQAASAGSAPAPPAQEHPTLSPKSAAESCRPGQRGANPNEIVICAERSDGYRLNRDVMEAHREI